MKRNKLGKDFIKVAGGILHTSQIKHINTEKLEDGRLQIMDWDENIYCVNGIAALDIVMQIKPSALEGKRFVWQKNAWAFHNLAVHPMMQLLAFCGLKRQAIQLHDMSIPRPIGFKK